MELPIRIMKNVCLFLMAFLLVVVSCGDNDGGVVEPPTNIVSIDLRGTWSDDLLKFVTPKLVYTDAHGEHQKLITEEMREDDVWEMDGEIFDFIPSRGMIPLSMYTQKGMWFA